MAENQDGVVATLARKAAVEVVRILRQRGFIAFFAGGCVRDEVLGVQPKDYDVATNATPVQIAELFPRTSQVGAHFGVQLVKMPDAVIEVATFRTDGPYTDKRRPDSVAFSTPEEDARRRDFTINALFLDPLVPQNQRTENVQGLVIDHVGGLTDLKAGIVRAVGDPQARLAEDHLRALRAVRFAARLGFKVEAATASAITQHASDLSGVSHERIGDEVRRMLAHPTRAASMELLEKLKLDHPVFGFGFSSTPPSSPSSPSPSPQRPPVTFSFLRGCETAGAALGPWGCNASVQLSLAALALDTNSRPTAQDGEAIATLWRTRLCLSNDESGSLRGIFACMELLLSEFLQMSVSKQKRASARSWFAESLTLVSLLEPATSQKVVEQLKVLTNTPSGIGPKPLISGDDLVALGLKPGPKIKALLDDAFDAQLEDVFADKASGLAWVSQRIKQE